MPITRRQAIQSLALLATGPSLNRAAGPVIPAKPGGTARSTGGSFDFATYGIEINPRTAWVAKRTAQPKGLEAEPVVKTLLVHHSDSGNTYAKSAVPGLLRGFHAFHTGPEKKWADIAYNFFVDRHGGIWEGRFGSLEGPVRGSASGGNQGSSQLICLVGNHATEPPSNEAVQSLTRLLAALTEKYGINADPDATSTFVSLGSNRWKAGTNVTAHAIEGHRAMSMTACPGDAAFALIPAIRSAAFALRTRK